MKKVTTCFLGTFLFLVIALLSPLAVNAETNININIGVPPPPPPFSLPSPPDLMVIPQGYVYFVPDITPDIFFYHGYWYRLHDRHYYRSSHYNGPWKYWARDNVPTTILNLPPGHRKVPPGHTRIPYGLAKKNWERWEKEKHWDRHEEKEQHRKEHEYRDKSKGKGKH